MIPFVKKNKFKNYDNISTGNNWEDDDDEKQKKT